MCAQFHFSERAFSERLPHDVVPNRFLIWVHEELISTYYFIMVEGINLDEITFRNFESEADLKMVMEMITQALSEPYPVYTYRYFL